MVCTGGRCVRHWRMRRRRLGSCRSGQLRRPAPYVDLVRRWLIEDLTAPRKQRHTARRIWQRLVEEEDARVGESTVRNLVARLRTEIGANRCQVMVPQIHPPAAEAEVDFGEFTASIAGQVMKLYMFCMRLSHSGKAFHFGYANQTQESFLDGHVRAFEAFGGVPTGMIRYDNLKPAVIRIALGRERFEHPRFVAMRSHYGYDSFFCGPGVEGRMRRVVWRARSAASAAATSPRCRMWAHWRF